MAQQTNQNLLPKPPIYTPIWDKGTMPIVWVNWFNQLFMRAGAAFAPSQTDIEVLMAFSDVSSAATLSKVVNLEASVALLQSEVSTLQQQQRDDEVFLAFQKDVDHV